MQVLDPFQLIFKDSGWKQAFKSLPFLMSQHVLLLMGETAVQRGAQGEQKYMCSHQGLFSTFPSALERAVNPRGAPGPRPVPSQLLSIQLSLVLRARTIPRGRKKRHRAPTQLFA